MSSSSSAQPAPTHSEKEAKALVAEHTARSDIRKNFSYLWNPASATDRPGRLRTRALLRSLHSIGIFLYWRAVRWAKYAIVGAVVGALGSFAVAGSMASGVGFILAPTGIVGTAAIGSVWYLARWGWYRYQRRRAKKHGKVEQSEEPQVHPRIAAKEPELVPW